MSKAGKTSETAGTFQIHSQKKRMLRKEKIMMYIKDKMIGRLRVQVNEEEMEEIGIIWYMVFVLSVNT